MVSVPENVVPSFAAAVMPGSKAFQPDFVRASSVGIVRTYDSSDELLDSMTSVNFVL